MARHLSVLGAEPPPRPSRVALISLTTFCNAACPFCCVLDVLNRPELNPSDDKIRHSMREARERDGCTMLGFTGGEPTVHPRFAELCRYGKELGYEAITVNTNGIQFKRRAWVEEAFEAGLSHVDFSIHGDTADLHDVMMGRKGAWDAFVRGMEHVRELAPKHGVELGSTTVVTARNAKRLPEIADFLLDQGLRALRFKHCFEGGDGADADLVARYAELMGPVREAVRRVRARRGGVQVTHFPLCLLGDEAVFATDFNDEDILSINRDGSVLIEGRASTHRRESTSRCDSCALSPACTRLDRRYIDAFGEAELRPVRGRVELESFLAAGLAAHPGNPMRTNVRRFLDATAPDKGTAEKPMDQDVSAKAPPGSLGFISPTFRVLEVNWEHDYEMVKLGVPTVMGHLYRLGHRDVSHWDFDADICDACAADPAAFDLRAYFDQGRVKGFLDGTDDGLRAQTEKLLDVMGVTPKEIYGISLSAVLDRIVNVMALAAVGQCLAKVLKERHPGCYVVIGGLQASPDSTHPRLYTQIMEECSAVDYAFIGQVEAATLQMFRNLWNGRPERNRSLSSRILYRDDDGSVRLSDGAAGMDVVDEDLRGLAGLRKGLAIHTNRGAEAELGSAPEGDACGTGEAQKPVTVPVASLFRRNGVQAVEAAEADVERTHVPAPDGSVADDFERIDLDAREAGAHAWDAIPAAVPVFDPKLVDKFRYSGLQIMKRFHFDRDAMLRFSRFEGDRIVVLPHIFIRGCNAPCGFCTYAYSKIEGEDLAQTVAGLKFLSERYNCRHFHFLNTQINSVYRYAEAFCEKLIEDRLDILWSDCANMRSLDEPLLEKMRRSGAMRLVFGVESPDDSMLKMIHKGINVAKIERLLKASHDLGIWNHVLLIAGMPHETKPKQDRMMEFLERTAPTVDFYSVSSYYLISTSPWGKEPEKYGIERITSPEGYLEEQSFHEVKGGRWESDGLRWPEKRQQIVDSTQRFYKTISRAKGQSRCVAGNIDLYLLMFLYSTLGHDQKAEIVRLYTETSREIFPGASAGDAKPLVRDTVPERNRFRVLIPHVVGRVNEGDQSALIQVPIDFIVSPKSEGRSGFGASERYTFAWHSEALSGRDDRLSMNEAMIVKESIPALVNQVVRVMVPFLQAMDAKLAPTTAERMAELASINLPRYKAFASEGYRVVGPATKRTVMDRTLEWSQGSSSGS
jgi:MoaA/NifB/PqqE/SkfB family radical SAM enzyme/radical SAM superfamily enzyme YgiQ (UPF0313 family)